MFLQRTAVAAARRAAVAPIFTRTFTTSFVRRTQLAVPVVDIVETLNLCPRSS